MSFFVATTKKKKNKTMHKYPLTNDGACMFCLHKVSILMTYDHTPCVTNSIIMSNDQKFPANIKPLINYFLKVHINTIFYIDTLWLFLVFQLLDSPPRPHEIKLNGFASTLLNVKNVVRPCMYMYITLADRSSKWWNEKY